MSQHSSKSWKVNASHTNNGLWYQSHGALLMVPRVSSPRKPPFNESKQAVTGDHKHAVPAIMSPAQPETQAITHKPVYLQMGKMTIKACVCVRVQWHLIIFLWDKISSSDQSAFWHFNIRNEMVSISQVSANEATGLGLLKKYVIKDWDKNWYEGGTGKKNLHLARQQCVCVCVFLTFLWYMLQMPLSRSGKCDSRDLMEFKVSECDSKISCTASCLSKTDLWSDGTFFLMTTI